MSGPTAPETRFRNEFIAGFEHGTSVLRSTVTTEAVIKGLKATFLVADSGSATAVTRGVNGLIPARSDNNTQTETTLAEWHDLVEKTGFNIFQSQGDQRRIMQMTTMKVINRKIDLDIIAQLDTATNDTGAATTASLNLVTHAKVILGNNFVPTEEEDNMFAVVTPAYMGYLHQVKEFASADYVEIKPFVGPTRKYLRWMGVNFIENPLLTGNATASEKCYMYHRSALGHAADVAGIQVPIGYEEKQDISWCRATIFMGNSLLQNSGVVQMLHNGAGFAAT